LTPGLKDTASTKDRISIPLWMISWPVSKGKFDGKGCKYLILNANITARPNRVHMGSIDEGKSNASATEIQKLGLLKY
jgi:hypothetical protein